MAFSIAFHVALGALAWSATLIEPAQIDFLTYEIELVSPPPAQQADEFRRPTEELVVERPEPEPTPPEPEVEETIPVEEAPPPEPEPVREEPPAEEQPPEAAEEPVVATAPSPAPEEAEVSGEGLNIRIEGLRRDYPQYYNNIIRQIQRCFRWRDGGSWETTIFFYIDREGNAEGLEFVSRSGNAAFDFEALGAVECAGRGRFGPLPEDLPYDRFPFLFDFQPIGQTLIPLAPGAPSVVGQT